MDYERIKLWQRELGGAIQGASPVSLGLVEIKNTVENFTKERKEAGTRLELWSVGKYPQKIVVRVAEHKEYGGVTVVDLVTFNCKAKVIAGGYMEIGNIKINTKKGVKKYGK